MNITPDSFSDGGKINSSETVSRQIDHFRAEGCRIFDIGAESTAPASEPIGDDEEWSRIEKLLLPQLGLFQEGDMISLDTYKTQTMRKFLSVTGLNPKRVIFNDVSGKLDGKLSALLEEYPDLLYVYSHNLAPSRGETSHHMNFLSPKQGDEFLLEIKNHFLEGSEWFDKRNHLKNVLFDPCFGFSKNYSQNLDLIRGVPSLVENLKPGAGWLLGISRKSFLSKLMERPMSEPQKNFAGQEYAQAAVLTRWSTLIPPHNQIVIRLHDPIVFSAVKRCKNLFEY